MNKSKIILRVLNFYQNFKNKWVLVGWFCLKKNRSILFFSFVKFIFTLYHCQFYKKNLYLKKRNIYSLSAKYRFRLSIFLIIYYFRKIFFQEPGIFPKSKNACLRSLNIPTFNYFLIKNHTVNGFNCNVKFCSTCCIWRPPRSTNCSLCNVCSLIFDHHCSKINICISYRNYKFFIGFLFCLWWYSTLFIGEIISLFFQNKKKNYIKKYYQIGLWIFLKIIISTYIFILHFFFLFIGNLLGGGLLMVHFFFLFPKQLLNFLKRAKFVILLNAKK